MGERETKIQRHSKCVKREKCAKDVGVNSAEKEIAMRTERNRERCWKRERKERQRALERGKEVGMTVETMK